MGVANANSTPGFLRRLDFELVTPLPATVLLPLPGRGPSAQRLVRRRQARWRQRWPTSGRSSRRRRAGWSRAGLPRRCAGASPRRAPGTRSTAATNCSPSRPSIGASRCPSRSCSPSSPARPLDGAAARAVVRAACRFHRAPWRCTSSVNANVAFTGVLAAGATARVAPQPDLPRSRGGAPRQRLHAPSSSSTSTPTDRCSRSCCAPFSSASHRCCSASAAAPLRRRALELAVGPHRRLDPDARCRCRRCTCRAERRRSRCCWRCRRSRPGSGVRACRRSVPARRSRRARARGPADAGAVHRQRPRRDPRRLGQQRPGAAHAAV